MVEFCVRLEKELIKTLTIKAKVSGIAFQVKYTFIELINNIEFINIQN